MLRADGADDPPLVRARRGGGRAHRNLARGDRPRRPDRRRGRNPSRGLLRLPPLPERLMRAGIFATPRPVPGRLVPALGGLLVLTLALPVFLVAGWDLAGWALGAVLWVALEAAEA